MNEGTAEPLVLLARMELAAAAPKEVTLLPEEVTAPERLAFVVTVAAFPEMEPWIVLVNLLVPEKVLVSARSVEEAALIVMLPVPSKVTPLMVRPVCSAVAVPALPETEPVMSEVKTLVPEKVLAFARSVEEAALIVIGEAPVKETPLMVLPGERAEAVLAFVEVLMKARPPVALFQPST